MRTRPCGSLRRSTTTEVASVSASLPRASIGRKRLSGGARRACARPSSRATSRDHGPSGGRDERRRVTPVPADGVGDGAHYGIAGLLRLDPREFHRWSFAKKAAAFFRTSRSMRSSRTSLRSRANSSRSAVVRPVLPFVRSARASST